MPSGTVQNRTMVLEKEFWSFERNAIYPMSGTRRARSSLTTACPRVGYAAQSRSTFFALLWGIAAAHKTRSIHTVAVHPKHCLLTPWSYAFLLKAIIRQHPRGRKQKNIHIPKERKTRGAKLLSINTIEL